MILRSFLSPGDVVMLTAAVRDLQRAFPEEFLTDVRTSASQLWESNPYVTPLDEADPNVRIIDMQYPLIHQSNQRPYHFIHGYVQFLEQQLGVRIPVTEFRGDIHISDLERSWMSQVEETGFRGNFWIIMAGGKYDFTAKWWNPIWYQQIVDHFAGRIQFVQCGEAGHWHPPLKNVINLIGRTDIRQFVRLIYHADGVVCPVTFAMHLAAAVPTKPGKPKNRACVVIAGGREPPQWEAYPHHQYISTNGALDCCQDGGCWKSRCQRVNDGDAKDRELCEHPIAVDQDLSIPKCMHMIRPEDVIRRIEMYYEGGALKYNDEFDSRYSSTAAELFEDNVLARAESQHHRGRLATATHTGTMRNPVCGDQIVLDLRIMEDRVTDAHFDGRGCVLSRASASALCEGIEGKPLSDLRGMTPEDALSLLGVPLTRSRHACALLAFRCLQAAIDAA